MDIIRTLQNQIVSKIMKVAVKMYLIIFISASVVIYQYHLSTAWLITQNNPQEFRVANIRNKYRRDDAFQHNTSNSNNCSESWNEIDLPPLYVITPTYRRPEQLAELTRLSHTLMLVKNVHWLVIEDAVDKNVLIAELLKKTNLNYEHFAAPMPEQYKKKKKGPKPRGVSNRNAGLEWIRKNAKYGVFYFADDDNTYDLQLFEEIRYTKQVSMFPVGLITKLGVSTPIVKNGTFAGFYDGWMAGRKFPVDMAGFAISVKFLLCRPNAHMPFKPGYEEDGFLKSLQPFEPKDVELLASNCTKILVWHTQTKKNEPSQPLDLTKYNNTNLIKLKEILV